MRIADLDGDGRDDYLWVDSQTGGVTAYLNGGITGPGNLIWYPKGVVAGGIGSGEGVLFADIDGDGLDDYLWVSTEGEVTAYRNGGPGSSSGWIWYPLGIIASGMGGSRGSIQFADIDGDGRAEYLWIGDHGEVTAYFNDGIDITPHWREMGEIASGIGDAAGVHLIDINGDGRADYVWLDTDGKATAYINYRGHAAGLAPEWVPAGVVAGGVGTSRDNITFGDLSGTGKADYVWVDAANGALKVWVNQGLGGTFAPGDEVIFADIDGDGREDYLSVDNNGAITAYINGGGNPQIWYPQGVIATGVGSNRSSLRMADVDGDGKADYLVVDEATGAVQLWKNGGYINGKWIWYPQGEIASGVGAGDGVFFADIDGDGKADYLWVDEKGATSAYLNGGYDTSASKWLWYPQGTIATGVGAARRDVQFADIDGDGKAEYLWVHRWDGSVSMWHNGGLVSGKWIWIPSAGPIATGVGSNGLCIKFADIDGDRRADYLDITPALAAVSEWANGCSGQPPVTPPPPATTPTLTPSSTCDDLKGYSEPNVTDKAFTDFS